MSQPTPRRHFLRQGAVAVAGLVTAAVPARPAVSMDPFARTPARKFKISCAAYSLRKYLDLRDPSMTLEQFIEKCAEWESDGTELTEYYFQKPVTPEYVSRLKRQAILWGLDITGTPVGNRFTFPPGEARDRQIETMKKWIDVSADLGSPAIRIFAGNTPAGVEASDARKWVVECIESCCDRASKRGVFLALENHGGVVADAEGVLEIIRAIRCEWVGVNLDTGNFHTADPYVDLERCAPYAVACQVKTEMRPAGGERQETDLARLVRILRKANYRGYLTLEYEGREEPLEAVPRHLAKLREIAG